MIGRVRLRNACRGKIRGSGMKVCTGVASDQLCPPSVDLEK
jgi:hypothetical protein